MISKLLVAFGLDRKSADDAIQSLNGTVIGKNTVRLSWGRAPNKQVKVFTFGVGGAFYLQSIFSMFD